MAHYNETEKGQGLFLMVNLSKQIVTGKYEHTFNQRKVMSSTWHGSISVTSPTLLFCPH